jgi:hypothetical protein
MVQSSSHRLLLLQSPFFAATAAMQRSAEPVHAVQDADDKQHVLSRGEVCRRPADEGHNPKVVKDGHPVVTMNIISLPPRATPHRRSTSSRMAQIVWAIRARRDRLNDAYQPGCSSRRRGRQGGAEWKKREKKDEVTFQ